MFTFFSFAFSCKQQTTCPSDRGFAVPVPSSAKTGKEKWNVHCTVLETEKYHQRCDVVQDKRTGRVCNAQTIYSLCNLCAFYVSQTFGFSWLFVSPSSPFSFISLSPLLPHLPVYPSTQSPLIQNHTF